MRERTVRNQRWWRPAVLVAWWLVLAAVALPPVGAAASREGGPAHQPVAIIVSQGNPSYKHVSTIQAAVNEAQPGDWILITPGVYTESVTIKTPDLHVRGMDRNAVILDGLNDPGSDCKGRNGFLVTSDGVSIENLTVRNYANECTGGELNGNGVWFDGGGGSVVTGKLLHGYAANYVTSYNTGLVGNYGIFAGHAMSGTFAYDYASGWGDSGFYIGACPDCQAVMLDDVSERNALGYSGTNSGGHLQIIYSEFDNNTAGIVPNSLKNGDLPPPQDGKCPGTTPHGTNVQRCTMIQYNYVHDNNNINTPGVGIASSAPVGTGIEIAGGFDDLVQKNLVTGNTNYGVVVHPLPPYAATGTAVENNLISGATGVVSGTGDLALADLNGKTINNCFQGNTFNSSDPASIEITYSCALTTTPTGDFLVALKLESLSKQSLKRHSLPQPAPGPRDGMANPCDGTPVNPLCTGQQRLHVPTPVVIPLWARVIDQGVGSW